MNLPGMHLDFWYAESCNFFILNLSFEYMIDLDCWFRGLQNLFEKRLLCCSVFATVLPK